MEPSRHLNASLELRKRAKDIGVMFKMYRQLSKVKHCTYYHTTYGV